MPHHDDDDVARAELTALPGFDNHERVIRTRDPDSGLLAFVAIHSTALGGGMGGCRMKSYSTPAAALEDALRLSAGMTYKYAAAGLRHGGAKAVILGDGDTARRDTRLLAFGRFVERLEGLYVTAEDAGISTADVRLISAVTRHIRNLPLDDTGDGALCTAYGVFHGMAAALAFRGHSGFLGRTVAVEGLGKVGMTLCGLLHAAGAKLIVFDIDADRIAAAAARYGATEAAPGTIHAVAADVYAPCALGGVLTAVTVPQIRAEIIAGAANNQLDDPAQAEHLDARGVLYCPDYVVNAGGVLAVAAPDVAYERAAALARVEGIRATMDAVLDRATRDRVTPLHAADASARAFIRDADRLHAEQKAVDHTWSAAHGRRRRSSRRAAPHGHGLPTRPAP